MARRPSLQEEIERVAALRELDDEDELRERLRGALGDRRPLVAGKAARVAADRLVGDLAPEITSALDRLLGPEPDTSETDGGEPAKPPEDPGCLGKTDLARALLDLEYDHASEILLRCARCVQLEPVWGGQVDAAAELRGLCAMGLARSADRRVAEVLSDLLADPEAAARSGAVRALAASGRIGAELLLRFKVRIGDDEPGVLLDALAGLLELEPDSGMRPVVDALSSADEIRFEAAAIALGSSRHPEALSILTGALDRTAPWQRDRRKVLLRAVSLQRGDDVADYLASLVGEAPKDDALFVLDLLGEVGVDHRLRDRLAETVDARADRDLSRAFRALG